MEVWVPHFRWSHKLRAISIIWWMIQSTRWWWCPMWPPKTRRIICWRLRSPMIISLKIRYMAVIALLLARWIFHQRSQHSHNLMLNLCHQGLIWDLMNQMYIINLMCITRSINWSLSVIIMIVLLLYSLDMIILWIWMLRTS